MCGEHLVCLKAALSTVGSSPHVRGAHPRKPTGRADRGIIPACAGSTGGVRTGLIPLGDHPRMCGDHPLTVENLANGIGIIPACAGSTMKLIEMLAVSRDHPRMCGEHSDVAIIRGTEMGSSPHVRGALNLANGLIGVMGIIPACAGST